METLLGLFTSRQFPTGAAAGLIALGVAYLLRKRRVDLGLLWTAAAVVVLWGGGLRSTGGLSRADSASTVAILAAVVAAGIAAWGLWQLREVDVAAIALAGSIGGIWATVPDTENAAVLLGVTAAVVWAWWPFRWARPRPVGAITVTLVAAWIVTIGALARDTGLVGGLGCLLALAITAIGLPRSRPWILLAGHMVIVLIWSRWAGLVDSVPLAVTIGAIGSIAVVALAQLVEQRVTPA